MYITLLPATPTLLFWQYPTVANKIFSADRLPVSFPLSPSACRFVEMRIKMRGGPSPSSGSAGVTMDQLRGQHTSPCSIAPYGGDHRYYMLHKKCLHVT